MIAVKTYLSSAMEYSVERLTLIQSEGGITASYSIQLKYKSRPGKQSRT